LKLHPLVGHEPVRRSLARAFAEGVLPSALLIHGARGVGKQRLALWIAQLHVCERPDGGPCDTCRSCRMALSLEHPDVHWYFPLPRPKKAGAEQLADALEEARQEALAEVREQPLRSGTLDEVRGLYVGTVRNMRSRAHMRPTMASGPVFIVGDAELLVPQEASQEAANALLKLLEEPPGAARVILTSSEPGALLPTVRSRTVPLRLGRLSDGEVAHFLEQLAGVDAGLARWAASLAQGSPGRALGFLPDGDEPGALEALRQRAFELIAAAIDDDRSRMHACALGFPPAGARKLLDLFVFLEEWLRDLAAVAVGSEERILNRDAVERLRASAVPGVIAAEGAPDAFDAVARARELARGNVNPQLVVSGLLRELRGALRPAEAMAGTRP
jgi:DNA polymerase-3 subunit delta'